MSKVAMSKIYKKWRIGKSGSRAEWYIVGKKISTGEDYYLHRNGQVHPYCGASGYFETKTDAAKMISYTSQYHNNEKYDHWDIDHLGTEADKKWYISGLKLSNGQAVYIHRNGSIHSFCGGHGFFNSWEEAKAMIPEVDVDHDLPDDLFEI